MEWFFDDVYTFLLSLDVGKIVSYYIRPHVLLEARMTLEVEKEDEHRRRLE